MEAHVKIVGILHAAWGAMALLGASIVTLFFGGLAHFVLTRLSPEVAQTGAPQVIAFFITLVLGTLVVAALPGFIAGIGVLGYRNWARWVLVVLSVLHLFAFPVGTLLGGYCLWVLLSPETARLFETANPPPDTPTPSHLQL